MVGVGSADVGGRVDLGAAGCGVRDVGWRVGFGMAGMDRRRGRLGVSRRCVRVN
jgi:hypothetical protein